ncbi:MAG: TetR/AcrR family transcriptional regulator [Propionibacteriaceae bacterium]|nr:TetR/AcrR family transcriptional regulator [Propionibacteriaceae bacterium]
MSTEHAAGQARPPGRGSAHSAVADAQPQHLGHAGHTEGASDHTRQAPKRRTRRHGEALDDAILDAAWRALTESGYGALTFKDVAVRARTSPTVLYRRWPTRQALAQAALDRQRRGRRPAIPDTGSLRTDLIAHLTEATAARADLAALVVSLQLAAHAADDGLALDAMRDAITGEVGVLALSSIYLKAQQRGEINLVGIPQQVLDLPVEAVAGRMLITSQPPAPEDITTFIDDVFWPLLRAHRAVTAQE